MRDTLSRVKRILLAPILLSLATPASAAFNVCNQTRHAAGVALGYYDGKSWDSTGWWTIAPGTCAELIRTKLGARYYYLYAVHYDVGGGWDGGHGFCVGSGEFHITGRANCAARGFERKSFFQVDTGELPDWTQNLAD